MKLRSLRMIDHFLAACRKGSFHAAARDLGITQTAITKSIRELEDTLSARLFDRTRKGVGLTIFGEHFLRRAIQIEQQSLFLERELDEMSAGKSGRLSIGAGTVWSDVFLPAMLASFVRARPNVEFVIRRGVGVRFRNLLESGEIDLGLGLEPSSADLSSDLIFDPIARIEMSFFVRRDHPLTRVINPGIGDIAAYPWAMYRLDTTILDRIGRMYRDQGETLGQPSFLADSSTSVMGFVADTDHVTCLPAPILPIARQFNLVMLDGPVGPSFQSGAVYMAAASDYPLMQAVLKELKSFSVASGKGFAQH